MDVEAARPRVVRAHPLGEGGGAHVRPQRAPLLGHENERAYGVRHQLHAAVERAVAFEVDPVLAPLLRDARHGRRPVAAVHLQLDPQDEGVPLLALCPVEAGAGLVAVGADGAVEPARGAVPAHQLAAAPRHVVLAEPLPAVRAFRVPFGALGAERAPARVADEPLRLPREPPPASVARPRQLRRARRAQEPPVALHGVQALPRHVPAAGSAPPVALFRAAGARAPHRAVLGRERASAVAAELPHRLRVVGGCPSPRHGCLLRPRRRALSARLLIDRCLDGRRTPAAPAEGSAGSARGKGGMRRPSPRPVVSQVVSRAPGASLPGKNPGKHRGPCRASGFRGRLPSRGSVLRGSAWWARPGGREGDPQGPALGRGFGAARVPGSGKDPIRSHWLGGCFRLEGKVWQLDSSRSDSALSYLFRLQ